MFKSAYKQINHILCPKRKFSVSSADNSVVTIVGAGGVIGQLVTLLLKTNICMCDLRIHDLKNIAGVTADVSHIDTRIPIKPFEGKENLKHALSGAEIVLITAGGARQPDKPKSEDLFETNAPVIYDIAKAIGSVAPKAVVTILTNPVNSLVPLADVVLQHFKDYKPGRILGLTHMDVVRASAYMRHALKKPVHIPVIGGHTEDTIVPLLSHSEADFLVRDKERSKRMYDRIRKASTEHLKLHGRSARLSVAYSTAKFIEAVCNATEGEENKATAFIKSDVTELHYFASPVLLGEHGVKHDLGLPTMNCYEDELYKLAVPIIRSHIQRGMDYAEKRLANDKTCGLQH